MFIINILLFVFKSMLNFLVPLFKLVALVLQYYRYVSGLIADSANSIEWILNLMKEEEPSSCQLNDLSDLHLYQVLSQVPIRDRIAGDADRIKLTGWM